MTIFDIVTAESIAAYWENIPNTDTFMFEELFPAKKQLSNKLSYIKGRRGAPIAIRASSYDAKVMPRSRQGFDKVESEIPFFKESIIINEELRQKLNMVLATNNQAYIDSVLNEIFDDEMELLRGARATREKMRAQLISTGAVTVNNNGVALSYDYGLEEWQKVTLSTATDKWSDTANSNPIEDLNEWVSTIKSKTGVTPTRAIMSNNTFNYIVKNEKLAKSIYITNNGQGIVTPTMVLDAIKVLTGLTVYTNDDIYYPEGTEKTKDAVASRYFPENVVSLLPGTTLGYTVFGTTPEESDLLSSPNIANVRIIDTGVAITTMKQADPVNVETKVSQTVMPSFENGDKILIATVA